MSLSEHIMQTVGLDAQREPPLLFAANRWDYLPQLFTWAGFTVGAEVGVAGGRFSKRLLETVPGLHMYCVDPWECYWYYTGKYTQADFDRDYRKAVQRLAPFDAEIIRDYSVHAAARFPDGVLDFVYIDAARAFQSVLDDLEAWWPKVRAGGVLCGPCYYNFKDRHICQVKDAVHFFTWDKGIDPWFVLVQQRYPTWLLERGNEGTA